MAFRYPCILQVLQAAHQRRICFSQGGDSEAGPQVLLSVIANYVEGQVHKSRLTRSSSEVGPSAGSSGMVGVLELVAMLALTMREEELL